MFVFCPIQLQQQQQQQHLCRCRQAQLGWTCGACVVSFVLLLWVRHRYRKQHLGTSEEKEALLGGRRNKGEDSAKVGL